MENKIKEPTEKEQYQDFLANFEKKKEESYMRAWWRWCRALETGESLSPILWDMIRKRIERTEGMPPQPFTGDDKKPIIIKIIKDDGSDGKTIQPAMGSV